MLHTDRRSLDDAWRRAHFQLISAVLYQADPLGRISAEGTEEYDHEARQIIKTLCREASVDEVEALVFDAFMIDGAVAKVARSKYEAISIKIFGLLKQFGA